MTEQEQKEQQQERAYKEASKYFHSKFLTKHYNSMLNIEDLDSINKRYVSDMLVALESTPEKKKEINDFWNLYQTKIDAHENKLEFLHETIEYLRELFAESCDPSVSTIQKLRMLKKVNNKDFIKNVSGRIKKRLQQDY